MTERASDWLKANFDWDKSGRGYIRKSDNRLTLLSDCMDEFSRERVLAELREACKAVCDGCASAGIPDSLEIECIASPIRQRIATLEAEG